MSTAHCSAQSNEATVPKTNQTAFAIKILGLSEAMNMTNPLACGQGHAVVAVHTGHSVTRFATSVKIS